MAIKKLIKFIRIRGRIIPIKFDRKLSKIPKIRFHQTDIKSADSIIKNGFNLNKTTHGVDSFPRGVFTKKSSKLISLQGKTQVKVLDLSKKTKVFESRNRFNAFGIISDSSIGRLHSKSLEIDRVMKKSFDRLLKKQRARRRAIIDKTGNRNLANLSMGKVNRLLFRWNKKQDEIFSKISSKNLALLKSKGFDSVEILKDHGGFGKVTDTKIIFDPKKVKPFKQFITIKNRKK